jgi:hypothetical protein
LGSFILIVCSTGCKNNSDSILLNGEKACWKYMPLKSQFEFDRGAGICFFKDGKCFDYVSRDSLKIPFSNVTVDVQEYLLNEILVNWTIMGDSLTIGRRKYFIRTISKDTILIENFADSILLVKDNTNNRTYWGHVIEDVPREYID